MTVLCWKCRHEIQFPSGSRVASRDSCPKCDADLHVCRNCEFYDPGKHNECSEPQADWVRDKEAANYCDYFRPNPVLMVRNQSSSANDTKKQFDSLFKV